MIEGPDGIPHARFGERDGPPGRRADLDFALTVDHSLNPIVEGEIGNAGQQHADNDRKNIPARDYAHNTLRLDRPGSSPEPVQ